MIQVFGFTLKNARTARLFPFGTLRSQDPNRTALTALKIAFRTYLVPCCRAVLYLS
jgi:hypothetical protein